MRKNSILLIIFVIVGCLFIMCLACCSSNSDTQAEPPTEFIEALEGNLAYCRFVAQNESVTLMEVDKAIRGELVIPSAVYGYPVTSIGSHAASGCTGLTNVVIPDSVTEICPYAFQDCTGLTSFTISQYVSQIGKEVFVGCDNLTGIWVDEKSIYYSNDNKGVLFDKSKTRLLQAPGRLEGTYHIPEDVKDFASKAFYNCDGISEVTIACNAVLIPESTFYDCDNLVRVICPSSMTKIGESAFYSCDSLTEVFVPNGVKQVGKNAFYDCTKLSNINISPDMTRIGDRAFYNCDGITELTISGNGVIIDSYAFYDCDNLVSIIVSGRVDSIDRCAFKDCDRLRELTISGSVEFIRQEAFANCDSIKNIYIPASVERILDEAFTGCDNLEGIWVEKENIKYCSDEKGVLFDKEKTHLQQAPGAIRGKYIIPSSVYTIAPGAFAECKKLTGVEFPNTVTSIAMNTFRNCDGLTEISLAVIQIDHSAFLDCDSLTNINIPAEVQRISHSAFIDCDSLIGIWVDKNNPYYSNDETGVLFNKEKTKLIQAPSTIQGAYIIPDSVTRISEDAFFNCDRLTDVVILGEIPQIEPGVFTDCDMIKSIVIPNSVTYIGQKAFFGCDMLENVYYTGSRDEWVRVFVGADNDAIKNATVTYNSKNS